MNVSSLVARLLGYADVSEIGGLRPSFGAPWAHQNPAVVVLACLAVLVLTFAFYGRWQPFKSAGSRWVLAALRGTLLCLLVLILTEPSLELTLVRTPKPVLWLLMDGTDSMSLPESGSETSTGPTRAEAVRTSLETEKSAWLKSLDDRFRLQVFEFAGGDGVQTLSAPDHDGSAAETPGEWLSAGRRRPMCRRWAMPWQTCRVGTVRVIWRACWWSATSTRTPERPRWPRRNRSAPRCFRWASVRCRRWI